MQMGDQLSACSTLMHIAWLLALFGMSALNTASSTCSHVDSYLYNCGQKVGMLQVAADAGPELTAHCKSERRGQQQTYWPGVMHLRCWQTLSGKPISIPPTLPAMLKERGRGVREGEECQAIA